MSIEESIDNRIREIVREELKAVTPKSELLFTVDELAARWRMSDPRAIRRLVQANKLRAVKLSDRNMVFTLQEIKRFEAEGGIEIAP